jgi:hypothetical protein
LCFIANFLASSAILVFHAVQPVAIVDRSQHRIMLALDITIGVQYSHPPHKIQLVDAKDLMPTAFVALVMSGVGLASLAHHATGEAEATLQFGSLLNLLKAESSMLSHGWLGL